MEKGICTSEIIGFLQAEGKEQKELHKKAASVRDENVSTNVYFRGLLEFSNICINDCFYCGIRKSNDKVDRYSMTKEEIIESVSKCSGYGSVVLQSGERKDKGFTDFLVDVIGSIKKRFPKIGITVCVGEQDKEVYQRFFDAGAHRYLLRIETSDKEHYSKLHPAEMNFLERKRCLIDLKDIGFQVGTGVMIGSPFQTVKNLASDLLFFKDMDIDMVGMGPFIPHERAPLKGEGSDLNLGLNMIAALRLIMPDINIASTTALQAVHPYGRELGLMAGANVIMPLVTPKKYRRAYQLYNDKPCINESSEECLKCIVQRVKSTNLNPAFNEWGDSKHFRRKNDSAKR